MFRKCPEPVATARRSLLYLETVNRGTCKDRFERCCKTDTDIQFTVLEYNFKLNISAIIV